MFEYRYHPYEEREEGRIARITLDRPRPRPRPRFRDRNAPSAQDTLGELAEHTREVAGRPTTTALMIEDSVRQMRDVQGFTNVLEAASTLHQLDQAHGAEIYGGRVAHAEVGETAVVGKAGR